MPGKVRRCPNSRDAGEAIFETLVAQTFYGRGTVVRLGSGLVALVIASSFAVAASAAGALAHCGRREINAAFDRTGLSEPTGEHTVVLDLVNRSGHACLFRGYPTVRLYHRSRHLPFKISHAGDQVVTAARPRAFVLRPSKTAYVVINKYRCDAGDISGATVIALGFGSQSVLIRFAAVAQRWISYCGAGDPGSVVAVSPFSPTMAAALTTH